ncbi:cell division protein ZipA [Thiorhodovibrio frisius]|uniref:Cell division protein ZipA n=1 Tax=Thiorhodovibrio frisius TaxID=631362 RepID=H8Z3Z8_9GAMM|nr:cell division protein ZipA C-terminal FtsZ-binding domain-containing protein [Thiorhodovibrio frisius]EIC20067.1 cell division protein [Thiorhodovibrio frisius]
MDATTLRIILLIVGIAFLVALFLWERNRTMRADIARMNGASPRKKEKREPNLGIEGEGDGDDWQPGQDASDWDYPDAPRAGDDSSAAATRHASDQHYQETPTGEVDPADIAGIVTNTEKGPVIQVFVVARDGNLSGRDILAAAGRHLLVIGSKDIFHRIDGDPSQPCTLFSMANLVQPGNFPLYPDPNEAMADFETRGIALFTQMHGEYQDIEALDAMLTTAKSLARELTAEIEDAQHRPISVKRIESLRNAVIDYADPDSDRGQGGRTDR